MKQKKQHLFFDLDHTLWDYEKNSEETLNSIFEEFSLASNPKATKKDLFKTFTEVNFYLWDLYDKEQIDKAYIREHRFAMIFEKMELTKIPSVAEVSDFFLFHCPRKTHLIAGTLEILNYLKPNYQLHILTNGFQDIQKTKLESCGLAPFFQTVTTSECSGYKKPHPKIFEFALQKANASISDSLMIGDNLSSDIGGAINIGMDCVFYNPTKKGHQSSVNYDIEHLSALLSIL